MPRKLRHEYAGAIYHVMNREDRQEKIFRGKQDREIFLRTLAEACAKTGWQAHAWCLMSNHFHLVIETPEENLVAGMKWLLAEGLKTLGWDEKELALRRKGDKGKVKLARLLHAQTTLTLAWVAQRLWLGSGSYTANLICEKGAQRKRINSKD